MRISQKSGIDFILLICFFFIMFFVFLTRNDILSSFGTSNIDYLLRNLFYTVAIGSILGTLYYSYLNIKTFIKYLQNQQYFNPWFITTLLLFIALGYLIISSQPQLVSALLEKPSFNKPTITPIPTIAPINLDENKLWNLVNDWEKQHGYQQYIKDAKLCASVDKLYSDTELLTDSNWFNKVGLNNSYQQNSTWLNTTSAMSEESVLNGWISDTKLVKTLRDYFYQYACIRCKNQQCIMMFANKNNQYTQQNISNNPSDPVITCNISPNCGSKVLSKSLCDKAGCCQIGDGWYVYFSREQCNTDQSKYNQAKAQNNEEYLRQLREHVQQIVDYQNQMFHPKEEFGSIVNEFNTNANQILNEAQNYSTSSIPIPTQDLSSLNNYKNIPTPTSNKVKCSSLQGIAYIEQIDCEP